jgi:hypothetical protein
VVEVWLTSFSWNLLLEGNSSTRDLVHVKYVVFHQIGCRQKNRSCFHKQWVFNCFYTSLIRRNWFYAL